MTHGQKNIKLCVDVVLVCFMYTIFYHKNFTFKGVRLLKNMADVFS